MILLLQTENYNIGILLHPNQKKRMHTPYQRALVEVITDIAQYALDERIALCFPRSWGWKHLSEIEKRTYDFSQMLLPAPIKIFIRKLY